MKDTVQSRDITRYISSCYIASSHCLMFLMVYHKVLC